MMERNNLELYYSSMFPIIKMREEKIIDDHDYKLAEAFVAEKYCIKNGNLYRLIDLTKPSKRVIYTMTEKEVEKNEEENNKTRHVTTVNKKN